MNFSQLGFGFFVLRINGLLLALIFCLVAVWYYKKLQEENLDIDFFVHHLWRWVLSGILVGRILSLIFEPSIFETYGWYSFFAFWEDGINFFGLFWGFIGFMFYDLKKHQKDPLKWFDILVTPLLIGICLSDLSAFLTGAVYGTETDLPWGIQYETFGVDTIAPVHPVTIYAFIIHFLLLNWVLRYGKNFYRQHGKLALITITLYFFAEFFLEFFVGNPTLVILDSIKIGQLFSLLTVTLLTIYLRKKS